MFNKYYGVVLEMEIELLIKLYDFHLENHSFLTQNYQMLVDQAKIEV